MQHDFPTASLQVVLVLAIVLSILTGATRADSGPFQNDDLYDNETYGSFPTETFRTTHLVAPRLNVIKHSPLCEDGLYTFLAPYGPHVQQPGPTILDNKGHLVWKLEGYGHVYNFKAQETEGKNFLTYWTGDDSVKGHGSGIYHVLDSSYNEVRVFHAANKYPGDHHEFILTDNGHAIITVYNPLKVDMTPEATEPTVGWIWECIFQELELETGNVKFEWKASEHFTLEDILRPMDGHGSEKEPLDWFHINSVDKDPHGNYLVSARYTFAAHYVDGKTGNVIWNFGGKHNSFRDLSDGLATSFVGQHDVRWIENYTGISVFDNAADWETKNANQSRGVATALNLDDMTAKLIAEYRHPEGKEILTVSQGSMQMLPSGNAMVGYGSKGAFTEFTGAGEVLCHSHFESESHFERGDAQSYRVVKKAWVGSPTKPPDFVLDGEVGFASWNGATEVSAWLIQSSTSRNDDDEESFKNVKRVSKNGFETPFALDTSKLKGKVVRAAAVDINGQILGASRSIEIATNSGVEEIYAEEGSELVDQPRPVGMGESQSEPVPVAEQDGLGLPIILVACVGTAALLLGAYELLQRRGRGGKGYRLLA
ncbi:MAG: hypothetical protein M1828_005594 [Chrysothrix sp. TS-e1954]|nr:MAG: hypothetical protein M1828_005594 [Chrysothrix sp. TS-e1954]